MAGDAVVIGSGAAGSVVAWELARAGWSVTVLERGRNMRPGFGRKPERQAGHPLRQRRDQVEPRLRDARPAARALHGPHPVRGGLRRRPLGQGRARAARRGGRRDDAALQREVPPLLEAGLRPADRPGAGRRRAGRRLADLLRRPGSVLRRGRAPGRRPGRSQAMPARTLEQSPRRRQFADAAEPDHVRGVAARRGRRSRRLHRLPATGGGQLSPLSTAGPRCVSCGLCSGLRMPDQRPRRRARLVAEPGGRDRAGAGDRARVRLPDRDRAQRAAGRPASATSTREAAGARSRPT